MKKILAGLMASIITMSSLGFCMVSAAEPTGLGDLNGDRLADARDAAMILAAAAAVGVGMESGLTAAQEAAADANGDGVFNAEDAAYILQYGAEVGSGNTESSFADWFFHMNNDLIYWDENDVFHIDDALLGMTYEEICTTLRLDLPEPEAWYYWGNSLSWSGTDEFALPSVHFMFQDGVCRMIYNDQDRSYTTDMRNAIISVYGGDDNVPLNDGACTFTAYSELYLENGQYYLRQQFVSSDMR